MSDFFVIPTFYLLFVVIRDGGGGGRDGGLSEATVLLTCLVMRDNWFHLMQVNVIVITVWQR